MPGKRKESGRKTGRPISRTVSSKQSDKTSPNNAHNKVQSVASGTTDTATGASAIAKNRQVTSKSPTRRPPGYTWQVEGRTKELRTLYVARKFFRLWRLRTFGRVAPRVADEFYQKKISRLCMKAWVSIWWSARREWKLQFRADYHYRFSASSKALKAWREWTKTSKEEKRLANRSERHQQRALLIKTIRIWKHFVVMRKRKKKILSALYVKADFLRQKISFQRWRSAKQSLKMSKNNERLAIEFSQRLLVERHYSAWSGLFKSRLKQKSNLHIAVSYSNNRLLRRCFDFGLSAYLSSRRSKNQLVQRANEFASQTISSNVFHLWMNRLQLRRRWLLRVDRASALATAAVQRRLFTHWRFYISLRRLKVDKWCVAAQHHRKCLLRAGIHALKLNATQMSIKALRNEMATRLLRLTVTRRSWIIWQKRLDAKEEARLYYVTREALEWRRLFLLRRGLKALVDNVARNKESRRKDELASNYFASTKLSSIVVAWRYFTVVTKDKRERKTIALSFLSEKRQTEFFFIWRSAFLRALRLKRLANDVLQSRGSALMKDVFRSWHQKAALTANLAEKVILAAAFYDLKWKGKCFTALKTEASEGERERRKERTAEDFDNRAMKLRALTKWIQFIRIERRAIREKAEKMRVTCLRRRSLFHRWHQAAIEQRKMKMAEKFQDGTVAKKLFLSWRMFVASKKGKHFKESEKIELMEKKGNLNCLRLHFDDWRSSTSELGAERDCVLLAYAIYHRQILNKALHAFAANVVLQKRKANLHIAADAFLDARLSSEWFRRWHRAAEVRKEETRKDVGAIYNWALRVQWKTFNAWKEYVKRRREKRTEEAEAREEHRFLLQREGVRLLFSAAASLNQIRYTSSSEVHRMKGEREENISRKVILRWKTYVEKKKIGGEERGKEVERKSSDRLKDPSRPLIEVPKGRTERRKPRCPDFLLELGGGRKVSIVGVHPSDVTVGDQSTDRGVDLDRIRHRKKPAGHGTTSLQQQQSPQQKQESPQQKQHIWQQQQQQLISPKLPVRGDNVEPLLPPSYFEEAKCLARPSCGASTDKDGDETIVESRLESGQNLSSAHGSMNDNKESATIDDCASDKEALAAEMKALKCELKRILKRKTSLQVLEENLARQKLLFATSQNEETDRISDISGGDDFLSTAIRETEKNIVTLRSFLPANEAKIEIIKSRLPLLTQSLAHKHNHSQARN